MSQDTALVEAIEARLFTVDDLPDEQHRHMENDGSEIDNRFAEPWLRVTHMFGGEVLKTLPAVGGQLWKSGLTQVDVYVQPKKGRERLDELADAIRAAFRSDLNLTANGRTLKIIYSKRRGGQMDGKWWADRIDIAWTLRAINPA